MLRKRTLDRPGRCPRRSPARERAPRLLALDDAVSDSGRQLKERGLASPYLNTFVVARVNPLRFIKGEPPAVDELLATMTKRARGMNVDKIKPKTSPAPAGPRRRR